MWRASAIAVVLLLSSGCDESFSLFGHRDVSEGTRSLGVVTFSRVTAIDETGGVTAPRTTERFAIDARFVRYEAPFESETRAILGLSDLDALPDVDACGPPASDPGGSTLGAAPPGGPGIELLDVGRIRVRSDGRERWLAVRTFPDLLDVMSGVTYGGAAEMPFAPGGSWEVRGDRDRTPWVTATAPREWSDLRVNGLPIADGLAGALDADRAVSLRWTPAGGHPSEVVVTLSWIDLDGAPVGIVCHPADDGSFELPADQAAALPAAPELAGLAIRVERLSRVSFEMDRVDEAETIFRVAVTAPLR